MSSEATCKVDHVISRYELTVPNDQYDSLDDYLVERWTGDDGKPALGYKQLTSWFNKRLMKQVYERHSRETMGVRLESEYEALAGDDEITRREVMNDLERSGIDAAALVDSMVSWSTIRRHLQECLDAEKEAQQAETNWEEASLGIARNQVVEKVSSVLRSWASKERLPDGHRADVEVQIKLACPECPTRVPLEVAADRGFVCSEHMDAVPATAQDGSSLSGSVNRAWLPVGLIEIVMADGMAIEELMLAFDAALVLPL